MKRPFVQVFIALAVAFTVILAQVLAAGPRKPETDEFIYLTIARDLR